MKLIIEGPWMDEEEMSSSNDKRQQDDNGTPRTIDCELSMEDTKKKLTELAKANEELVNKNTELLGKLKKADSQIIELEKKRRADKNQINALKKQLHKAAKHAQTKQIICVTEEKEEEEDRSKPVEEEEYNCRDKMEDHSCREEQPGTEEIFEQAAEPVPLQKIFSEDDEPVTTDVNMSKLDKLVAQAMKMAGKKNE